MSAFNDIETTFVNTVALIVLTAEFDLSVPYRAGWFDGYAQAYTQITGNSMFVLVDKVNKMLEGSGKSLSAIR